MENKRGAIQQTIKKEIIEKLSKQGKLTAQKLENKCNIEGARMPSIKSIHELLNEVGIKHRYEEEAVNVVEYRTGQRSYVNDRHYGKKGKVVEIEKPGIELDTSNSYYSWNSWGYSQKLIKLINGEPIY